MDLHEMLIAVTEHQPRGEIALYRHLENQPALAEMVERLAHTHEAVEPCVILRAGVNWLLDAVLNYGLPTDLEYLPREVAR